MTSPQTRPPTNSQTAQLARAAEDGAGRGASAGSRSAGAHAGGTSEPGLPATRRGATGSREGLAVGPDRRPADDLVIAGLVPMSTVDWPDHLTATVFLQGCPWNCFYCHNQALIPARTPGQVAWEEVRALLRRRRGLLDGCTRRGRGSTPSSRPARRGRAANSTSWRPAGTGRANAWPSASRPWAGTASPTARRRGAAVEGGVHGRCQLVGRQCAGDDRQRAYAAAVTHLHISDPIQ